MVNTEVRVFTHFIGRYTSKTVTSVFIITKVSLINSDLKRLKIEDDKKKSRTVFFFLLF